MKTADNGRGWQRIYDCTITRGNNDDRGEKRMLASERVRAGDFFIRAKPFDVMIFSLL